jgi:arginine decarboxylase
MVPKKVFLTKGVGVHKEKLASFELALRAAGLAHCNLVLVSSIYPPGCKIISKEEGLKLLRPGEIIFAVYDRESSNEPNRLVAASVGLAVPADPSMHGYLSEHHSFGETDEKAGEYAEDLAASMLATTVGIEFNPELDWDEREHIFKMSGKIVRTSNITQSAVGNKDGLWTTVFAAAVFINDENLSVEAGKPQGDGGLSQESGQGDAASPAPEPQQLVAGQSGQSAGAAPSGHDQQEVSKAIRRAFQQGAERFPQAKDALVAVQDDILKTARPRLPKPV